MSVAPVNPPSAFPLPPSSLPLGELAALLGQEAAALAEHLKRSPVGAIASARGGRTAVSREASGTLLRERLTQRGSRGKPIAFINLKGGVGKTTLAINLAARAQQFGLRVCLLDLDPQASSTLALIGEPEDDAPVFLDVWQAPTQHLPQALLAVGPRLDLLPSALDNTLLDGQLAHPAQQKKAVAGVCERLAALGYDLVLIDCPPALGTAVISTLCAAHQLLVPVCADAFSMKGLRLTLDEMAAIGETFALPMPRVRIVFNRFDRRERLHADVLARLRERHPAALMQAPLRVSSHYARALAGRRSVFDPPRSPVAAADLDACLRALLGLNEESLR